MKTYPDDTPAWTRWFDNALAEGYTFQEAYEIATRQFLPAPLVGDYASTQRKRERKRERRRKARQQACG